MFSLSTLILSGSEFRKIDVEISLTRGLPYFEIIGLPGKIVRESSYRIKEAVLRTMGDFPHKKIIVNLSPSDIPKNTKYLDLVIALNIMVQAAALLRSKKNGKPGEYYFGCFKKEFGPILFIGELGLDGEIKSDSNALAYFLNAHRFGYQMIVTSPGVSEGQGTGHGSGDLLPGLEQLKLDREDYRIIPVRRLGELYAYIGKAYDLLGTGKDMPGFYGFAGKKSVMETKPFEKAGDGAVKTGRDDSSLSLADYKGNDHVKFALLVALCGFHNVYIQGPTGTGKTMLSKCIETLLPPMTIMEKREIAEVFSMFDLFSDIEGEIRRPVRSPHHSITLNSMIGGGNPMACGEVTLANRGILVLDEVNLFRKSVIESLREPLFENRVNLSRLNKRISLPSVFLLVMISNLCPCGLLGDPGNTCTCSPFEKANFDRKISSALLDRIDLHLICQNVAYDRFQKSNGFWETENLAGIIQRVRDKQIRRYKNELDYFNGKVSQKVFFRNLKISDPLKEYAVNLSRKSRLSYRQYEKVYRIARTIADINGRDNLDEEVINQAIFFMKDSKLELTKAVP